MGLFPNIYYHARTPATAGPGEYTFSRLTDATSRQSCALKIQKPQVTWASQTPKAHGSHIYHGYRVPSDGLPAGGRMDPESIAGSACINRPSESSRHSAVAQTGAIYCEYPHPRKACSLCQLLESRSTPEKNQYGNASDDPPWMAQPDICHPCPMCRASQSPGFVCAPPMCPARHHDTGPQTIDLPPWGKDRVVDQPASSDSKWELDSNSDGGVPLEDSQSEAISAIVEEVVRVIENLQAGYLADTEDGGNGYEACDGDDFSEDDYGGEDSDHTVRAWGT